MKHFRPLLSLYLLPVYFFTLAVSPNISGDRIGVILAIVYIGLIPLANYLTFIVGYRTSTIKMSMSWLSLLTFLSLVLGSFFLSWQINWQLGIMAFLFVLVSLVLNHKTVSQSRFTWLSPFLVGVLLFSINYLGLNQYGFGQLFSLKNILVATLCGVLVSPVFYLAETRNITKGSHVIFLLVVEILLFGIYFTSYNSLYYAALFIMAILPAGFILNKHKYKMLQELTSRRRVLISLSYSLALVGFFIYFFLESTQVLQAIRAGY